MPTCIEKFVESILNFKGFHEVNRITVHAGTACGTSGIITFGERILRQLHEDIQGSSTVQTLFFYAIWFNDHIEILGEFKTRHQT